MRISLFTDYPWYFILLCLLLGAALTYFTYQKNTITENGKRFGWPVWLLMLLRFIGSTLLAFLLLSPVVRSVIKHVEKPIVVIAADNSQSVLVNRDSAYYRSQYPKDVQKLIEALGDRYDVRTYSFGSRVDDRLRFDFSEKQTDLSGLYDRIYNTFYNQNVGAVITLTDGIYNLGQNPQFIAEKFNAPFYMVGLGDTMPQNDVTIKDVQYNQVVYSGNQFPVNIQLKAKGFPNQDVQLRITNKGNTVFSQPIRITDGNFFREVNAQIKATGTGLQHYHISLSHLPGEVSYVNNEYDLFIDVMESRKKILIVAQSPHPDIAALKGAIERNAFYEVQAFVYPDFVKAIGANATKLKNYQLAILHQLPGRDQGGLQLVSALKEAQVPILYVIGAQTYLPSFNNLDAGVQLQQQAGRANDILGYVNPQFGLFTLSPDLGERMAQWPPLTVPFGDYKPDSRENIVLYQQLGKVKTDLPLLIFGQNGKEKSGVLCGEGIWRWPLAEYARYQEQKTFDELVSKTVQYLSVRTDNRPFRLKPGKNLFLEDENVTFEAEVYNQSFEPVPDARVDMKIRSSDGKEYEYTFQPRGNGYMLDAGRLPAGSYTYTAQTKIAGKPYTLSGEFIVKKIEIEYIETVANHQLLNAIASQQGGKLVYPRNMGSLASLIEKREDITPVAYMQTDFRDLIEYKWLFFLLLALFGTEWFLRKYYGTI